MKWSRSSECATRMHFLSSSFTLFRVVYFSPLTKVLVALKAGQGGTPLDLNLGAKANTWRVVELAHAAGLVCASVLHMRTCMR